MGLSRVQRSWFIIITTLVSQTQHCLLVILCVSIYTYKLHNIVLFLLSVTTFSFLPTLPQHYHFSPSSQYSPFPPFCHNSLLSPLSATTHSSFFFSLCHVLLSSHIVITFSQIYHFSPTAHVLPTLFHPTQFSVNVDDSNHLHNTLPDIPCNARVLLLEPVQLAAHSISHKVGFLQKLFFFDDIQNC